MRPRDAERQTLLATNATSKTTRTLGRIAPPVTGRTIRGSKGQRQKVSDVVARGSREFWLQKGLCRQGEPTSLVPRTEKITRVPSRAFGIGGDVIPEEKIELGLPGGRLEVERLMEIVFR